ncbi:MAG TPA: exodeoxyribonuclease VII small subunit [Candidatus Saccharimonadales bacterium]|nr:exodeoxyribonuclease VII small subunit [Candidatus Saccharimonadales bacterium]
MTKQIPPAEVSEYTTLNSKLEEVLAALQQPDISVTDAMKLYEEGIALVAKLEDHVAAAEVTLKKIKLEAQG